MKTSNLKIFAVIILIMFIQSLPNVNILSAQNTHSSYDKRSKDEAPPEKLTEEELQIRAINRVRPSVVRIESVTKEGNEGVGSGVIIKENGFILTNYHVVRNAAKLTVCISDSERKFHAVVIGKSPRNDLAVIRINASNLKVPKWGDSRKLKIGQAAIAIGNPYKFEGTVSRGIISALDRRIAAAGTIYKELIQTDAAINPGNSGGALINSKGYIIGINTLVYSGDSGHTATGLGFAIPAHRALDVARKLMSSTVYYSPQPWIGINGVNITKEMAESNMLPVNMGVIVTDVQKVSPAERAGLMKGDIVAAIDDKLVRNVDDFKKMLMMKQPGEDMLLKVWRDNKAHKVKIKVSQRSIAP